MAVGRAGGVAKGVGAAVGSESFVVAVPEGSLAGLAAVVAVERDVEAAWLARERGRVPADATGRERAEAARAIRAERAARRAAGELAGTRDLVVGRALRAVLAERGWAREWPTPPDGELDAPGRRIGRAGPDDVAGPERLTVRLPVDLAQTARRAAYWTSAPAVAQLREWADRWGDGPDVVLTRAARAGVPGELALFTAAAAKRPDADALLDRARLRAQIVTTGDLIRAAVAHAIPAPTT